MIILEVKNLKVVYENKIILNNINFSLSQGEILAIIGPNGAGKTTLLKAILGLIDYEGEIKYKGDLVKNRLKEIAYIPQKFDFDKNFPLTVKEFLSLSTSLNKEIIDEIGIKNLMNKKLGELSGGQLQRFLIARALLKNSQLILMDEPTAGIDIEGEKKFYEILLHLNTNYQITLIFVSHEINLVYHFAKKVLCLNKDLLCYGEVKKELTEKTLKSLYGEEFIYQIHQHEN
jgi:zinc transport system ATP-binding protein